MATPEIIAHTKKGLAVIEWALAAALALIALIGITRIPQNPVAWILVAIFMIGLATICGLMALSISRSRLILHGTTLSNTAIRKSIDMDKLASVHGSIGYAFTSQIVLKDRTGDSLQINFAGYPPAQLRLLMEALGPYIVAPSVEKEDDVIKKIDQVIAQS